MSGADRGKVASKDPGGMETEVLGGAAKVGFGAGAGEPLDGWLPIGVSWRGGTPWIDWCLARRERFLEPFFDQTVSRLVSRPFNRVFRRQTDVGVLQDWAARRPGLQPDGFIFHMSRCGSTLVAQMLAARSDSIVLSEPAPFDAMLRPPATIPQEQHIRWLRALVSAMGQPRIGTERHFFIKLDCWHILDLSLIRHAFPSVPWIFLYREPRQVMASHLRQRGVQTVPALVDPLLFGIEPHVALTMPGAEYCARVLGRLCAAAAGAPGGRLVNYRQLPDAVFETILPWFGLPWFGLSWFGVPVADDMHAAMRDAARRYSKAPGPPFSAANDAPPIPADGPAEAAVVAFLDEPYRALERRRMAGEG
jgi:hypothetical protein